MNFLNLGQDISIIIFCLILIFLIISIVIIIRNTLIVPSIEKILLKELKNKKFNNVIKIGLEYLNNNPDLTDIRTSYIKYYIAEAYENIGNFEKAIDLYSKALLNLSQNKKMHLHIILKIAQLHEKLNKTKEAFAYYLMAQDVDKSNLESIYKIAQYHYNNKNYNKAREIIEVLIKKKPNLIDAHLLYAKVLFELCNYSLAFKHIKIIENYCNDLELKFLKAKILENMKRYNDAILEYNKIINYITKELRVFNDITKDYFRKSLLSLVYLYLRTKEYSAGIELVNKFMDFPEVNEIRIELLYYYANLLWNNLEEYKALKYYEIIYNQKSDYKDVKDIYEKYKNILKYDILEFYFISNNDQFDQICKKYFKKYDYNLVYKSKDYFIYNYYTYFKVFYRHIEPISYNKLTDIEVLITTFEKHPQSIEIYTLLGVHDDAITHYLLKNSKLIENEDFINELKKVINK